MTFLPTLPSLFHWTAAVTLLASATTVPLTTAAELPALPEVPEVEVIAVTDTTPTGAQRTAVTPGNPAYYIIENIGFRVLGAEGPKESMPHPDEIIRTMAKVLSRNGYLPMSKAHPPSLHLVLAWGTMNADMEPSMTVGEGAGGETIESPEYQTNRDRLLRFLGGQKIGLVSEGHDGETPRPRLFYDLEAERIRDLSREDLYVAVVMAYDFAAMQRNERVLLWTTRLSCPARRVTMAEALPTLIASGGAYIGRETARPVSLTSRDRLKPDVRVGDPKVLQYLDPAPDKRGEAPSHADAKPGTAAPVR